MNITDLIVDAPAKTAEREAESSGRDGAKMQQILDGARKVFLSEGFDAASMNDIARVAGVSKGTLYVYFGSKEDLFTALIREEKKQQAERMCQVETEGRSLPEVLAELGRKLIGVISQPGMIAQVRTVVAAAGKFPKIGRTFYDEGAGYGIARLASLLDERVASGEIVVSDTRLAATHFLILCKGEALQRLLFGVAESVSGEQIDITVSEAIRIFMALYGSDSPLHAPSKGR